MPPRRQQQQILGTAAVLSLMLCISMWQMRQSYAKLTVPLVQETPAQAAENATLGFQKILAISKGTSWRIRGLRAAAAETGLDITVPTQPYNYEDYVRAFETLGPRDATKPSHGSALAWTAHMDLLKHIIQSGYDTTLILEDDADWSLEIKEQMKTLTEKLPQLTKSNATLSRPYGGSWDLLWLGHCGESWVAEKSPETVLWKDPTNGRREDWRGAYDKQALMQLPQGYRSIWKSQAPLCTFAYAVTQRGARKALKWTSRGADEAYDIALRAGCRSGYLNCISIVDQLFHHYRPPPGTPHRSVIDDADQNLNNDGNDEAQEPDKMGSTAVILHSARCKALFNSTCLDLSFDCCM